MEPSPITDPGLELLNLERDQQDWVIVGAESLHHCLSTGHLHGHQSQCSVHTGDIILIPRGTRYQLSAASRRLRIRNRALAQNLSVDRHAAQVIRAACVWANQHGFILPLRAAEKQSIAEQLDACFAASSLLQRKAAFFHLLAQLEMAVPSNDELPRHSGAAASIKTLLEHISNYYGEDISVSDAQAVTGLSRSHFHVAFRQATGTTFNRYLTAYRIGEACRLLRHTERTILDIAYSCGFGSPSRFFKAFKTQTQTTPERYRLDQTRTDYRT